MLKIWNTIMKNESHYNVFVNYKGEYAFVASKMLAFGNQTKEIRFTPNIFHATKFSPSITQLDVNDYHTK